MWTGIVAAGGSSPGPSSGQYWGGQIVLVLIALAGAWFALRGKHVDKDSKGIEVFDARLARSEARRDAELEYLDRELTEARAEIRMLRTENDQLHRALRRAGISVDDDGGG